MAWHRQILIRSIFSHADVIVVPVRKRPVLACERPATRMRDLDTPVVRQVVRTPSGAESVSTYRGGCKRNAHW